MKGYSIFWREDRGSYYMWFLVDGKRHQISCNTTSKREAQAFLLNFVKGKSRQPKQLTITISLLQDEYVSHSHSQGKTPKTIHNIESCLREFIKHLGNGSIPVRGISTKMCQDFIGHKLKVSHPTARRHYIALSAIFRYAMKKGYVNVNPFEDVNKPKKIQKHMPWIPKEQFEAFFLHIINKCLRIDQTKLVSNPDMQIRFKEAILNRQCVADIALVDYQTGMRSAEIRHLEFEHIDWDNHTLLVRISDTFMPKSKKERPIWIPDLAYDVLVRRRNAYAGKCVLVFPILTNGEFKVMGETYLAHQFKEWVISAKIDPDLHFHSLRHSYASVMFNGNVNPTMVQALMGHEDLRTTMNNYAHLQQAGLKQAVKVFNSLNEVKEQKPDEVE